MVVDDKIQTAKDCFQGITESGKNNFQNFTYFETKDIFPVVRKVCKQFNLKTKFNWDTENHVMTLVVTDRDDNTHETYNLPVAVPNDAKAGNYMQSIGSIQTYAMRYLYIQCFEITVPDEIDSKDNRQKPVKPQKPKKEVKKELKKEEPEPTVEDIKNALDVVYDIIVNQGGAQFTLEKARFQLQRQYKNKPKLIEACEKSLESNQANQVKQ